MKFLKEVASALFDDPKKQIILVLSVLVIGFGVREMISMSKDEVIADIEVIEDELQEDEVMNAVEMTKLQWMQIEQDKQIKALWISINRLEKEHKDHIQQRKH